MNKKLSKEMSAGTTDDSSTKADDMQVSPAIAKPHVVCSCCYFYTLIIEFSECRRLNIT